MSWGAALWSVVSVRWATVALLLFLAGLVAQLNGAPEAMWWTLYLACYLAGGWGSAWAGAQALRNKALDVDLLMIAAAVGAVAIGQIFDGALLIVIFATSGALDDIATRHTAESVKGLLDLAPDQAVVVLVPDRPSLVISRSTVHLATSMPSRFRVSHTLRAP
ncbi:hypothetical protein I110_01605 [Mycobacterium tuberculosis OFXR-10]|nr:hypothetical protein I110_01605 [Mycobacterium tuberculosis OFXR-10]